MVAPSTIGKSLAFDPAMIPASALAGRGPLVQFSVDEVMAMIRKGSVVEDATTELLNGFIVHVDRSSYGGDPAMHSPGHRKCVRLLTALVGRIDTPTRHTQIQLPIVCGDRQMPEPDFAVIRGSDSDFTDRLPNAGEALCVIEVADSSLERDRDEKQPIYARAGVQQYIIINLRNRTAEIYSEPDMIGGTYTSRFVITDQDLLLLRVGATEIFSVRLADVLP
jgi:Uma2 family endonuclease